LQQAINGKLQTNMHLRLHPRPVELPVKAQSAAEHEQCSAQQWPGQLGDQQPGQAEAIGEQGGAGQVDQAGQDVAAPRHPEAATRRQHRQAEVVDLPP